MAADRPASLFQQLRQSLSGDAAPEVTDADLLRRYVDGRDEAAFELLVRRHERLVWGVCRRQLRDRHDAEDAFQATFVVLARKAASVTRGEALAGWLHRVARRCAGRLRDRRRPTASLDVDPAGAAEFDALESSELHQLLDAEIERLPRKYRLPVVLCYLEGMTYDEAAVVLGCPKGTLSSWLTQARELLRGRLAARGVASAGAALAAVLARPSPAPAGLAATAARLGAAGAAPPIQSLAEEVMKTLATRKLRIVFAVAAAACVVGAVGLAASQVFRGDRRGTADEPPARVAGEAHWQECAVLGSAVGVYRHSRFAPDGRTLVTVSDEGVQRYWDTETWQLRGSQDLRHLFGDNFNLWTEFSADGRLLGDSGVLAPGKPGEASPHTVLFDGTTGREVARLVGRGPIFSPAGGLIATWHEKEVTLWDAQTFQKKQTLQAAAPLRSLRQLFSNDGSLYFATTNDGRGQLWETATGKRRGEPMGFHPMFSKDGATLLTHLPGNEVKLWDTATGRERFALRGETTGLHATLSPDGRTALGYPSYTFLANGNPDVPRDGMRPRIHDLDIRLYDAATGQETARLPGSNTYDSGASFLPDGATVVYSRLERGETERTELVLWDVAAKRERTVLRAKESLRYAGPTADGKTLFTTDPGGRGVRIWDAATGRARPSPKRPLEAMGFIVDPKSAFFAATPMPARPGTIGPADLIVFRLSSEALPTAVVRGERAKEPEAPVEVAKTETAQAMDALRKDAAELDARLLPRVEKATGDARRALTKERADAYDAFAGRALDLARKNPADAAATEALQFVLQISAGATYPKRSDEALALLRAGKVDAASLDRLLPFVALQHSENAERFLEETAERGASPELRGRSAFLLAESLAEMSEMARLLRVLPEIADHPEVQDKKESVERLRSADADTLARRAADLFARVRAQSANVRRVEHAEERLGVAAERGLFALKNLAIGSQAPEVEGKDFDGKPMKLSDYRGKVVVLIFCGHWCGPCRAMNPHKQSLVERLKEKPFALLEVNSDEDAEKARRTMAKEQLTWRCWADGGREGPIHRAWNVQRWPTIFVLDRSGVIRFKELRDDPLDRAVDRLLTEAP